MIRGLVLFGRELFFADVASRRLILGVLIGLSFSISIILATIGVMDGFDITLKKGLHFSEGDIFIFSRRGPFYFENHLQNELIQFGINNFSTRIDTEGFAIVDDISFGVLARGVDESIVKVSNLPGAPQAGQVYLGKTLFQKLGIQIGDEITLALSGSKQSDIGAPRIVSLQVADIVEHGIHQKDLRTVYLNKSELSKWMDFKGKVNIVSLKLDTPISFGKDPSTYSREIQEKFERLRDILGEEYIVRPFWQDFKYLIEAVEAEKTMIALILQLVVVISIFNVVAFIIFINERKAKEIFLLRALGLGIKDLSRAWYGVTILLWIFSCLGAFSLVFVYQLALAYLPFFKLPPEVYYLGELKILLTPQQYGQVFAASGLWISFMTLLTLLRIKRKSILAGLRQEFA